MNRTSLVLKKKAIESGKYSPPAAAYAVSRADIAVALVPMSSDREVIAGVENADVHYNAAVEGREVITGAGVDILQNAASVGEEVITGANVSNVQYNAGAAGMQPVSSFAIDSSMATSLPLAGDNTIHVPDEQAATFTAKIQSRSIVSTLKALATMPTPNEVQN